MGGEHKCPLCSATFTRPQHVGRHLRAHTGDRPYECKECPLRFARSDLLSRHVNKAHKPPDENGKPQPGKKGRRKSMPSSAHPSKPSPPPPNMAPGVSTSSDQNGNNNNAQKARRASFDPTRSSSHLDMHHSGSMGGINMSQSPSMPQPQTAQAQQPPLQAQSMYPHHPLLVGSPTPNTANNAPWTATSSADAMGMMLNSYQTMYLNQQGQPSTLINQPMGQNGMQGFQAPFTAMPMRMSESDQGTSPMGRQASLGSLNGFPAMGYDYGFKKRACDQCNHSKVRCDFAEPCHRCSNRGLRCSYNKPQKSRTIATIPTQRMSLPMSAATSGMTASMSNSSASPHSQFSSPNSTTSPVTATMQPPAVPLQAIQASFVDPQQYSQFPTTAQWQNGQWPVTAQPMDQALGLVQTSPQTTIYTGQMPQVASATPQYHPVPLPHRNSGASSVGSPRNHLAPTPSLTHTSHSTSPSSSDEPAERRTSSISFASAWQDPKGKATEIPVTNQDNYLNTSFSPTSANTLVSIPGVPSYQADTGMFAWVPPVTATIDPRLQFRSTTAQDDDAEDGAARPTSSNASTYLEGLDENAIQALDSRRRSSASTGLWANAFDQMTLQDPKIIPADPYTASQIAQSSARRPSFPVMYSQQDSVGTSKMPSLGDVKDLWKLFMSEPVSSSMMPTTSNENAEPNFAQLHQPMLTPRPELGSRGLSKSNSMPDLTSPLNNAQPFFSTYINGVTPKPAIPQPSYNHQQAPEPGADAGEEVITMKRWKDSIKNRQASFELNPSAQTRVKTASPPNMTTMSPPDSAATHRASLDMGYTNRPLASVLQHSSALQQTLAPERVPSFGGDNLPTPTKNGFYASKNNVAKFSSALARPGNKRLASQTLVPSEGGKKIELESGPTGWGPEEDLAYADLDNKERMGDLFVMPNGFQNAVGSAGAMNGLGGTGSTPGLMQGQYFAWNMPAQSGVQQ